MWYSDLFFVGLGCGIFAGLAIGNGVSVLCALPAAFIVSVVIMMVMRREMRSGKQQG